MRSFASLLLGITVGPESVVLIDEPEAFLHPPQARLIGRMLVENKARGRQLFISTHSGDVLRGILDAESDKVRIVRLERDGRVNKVHELSARDVAAIRRDSLLRFSNVLDAVFHDKVVVCESDSDARFYSAIAHALERTDGPPRLRDVMFTHCGGKARIPAVTRSLRALGVLVSCVVDFDVLSEQRPLRDIVEAAGGDWSTVAGDWQTVRQSISTKRAEVSVSEAKRQVTAILDSNTNDTLSDANRQALYDVFRRASPWAHAKTAGKSFVPGGEPSAAYERLALRLRALNINLVEVGELERFVPTIGSHGPSWVNQVLESRNLAEDKELIAARDFARALVG
jgi:hypothetical protein